MQMQNSLPFLLFSSSVSVLYRVHYNNRQELAVIDGADAAGWRTMKWMPSNSLKRKIVTQSSSTDCYSMHQIYCYCLE